jgi:hypothetical protein
MLYDVHGTGPNDVWAVGDAGTTLHYDGTAWTLSTRGTMEALTGVWASSAADVWAVSSGGSILHFDGTDWKWTVRDMNDGIAAIHGAGGSVFAVGAGILVHAH